MKKLLLILALIAPLSMRATPTHSAANTSQAAVQAAITAAHDGDTVLIPAGTSTWTNNVTISSGKAVSLKGVGTGSTIINLAAGTVSTLNITVASGAFLTVEGIYFRITAPQSTGGIRVTGTLSTTPAFRITNCIIDSDVPSTIGCRGIGVIRAFGLIDNCSFINTRNFGQAVTVWRAHGTGLAAATSHANTMWYTPQLMGTAQMLYIEDCTFDFKGDKGDGALDAYDSSKFVFRYNTVYDTFLGWHGADSGDYPRAPRLWEVYGNNFAINGPPDIYTMTRVRGGTGVYWGNTALAGFNSIAWFSHYAADIAYTRAGWGKLTGSNPADGNFSGGYPSLDQIGRGSFGTGDSTPWYNAGITSYASQQSDYQEVDPVYVFLNNWKGNLYTKVKVTGPSQSTTYIQEDREMYHDRAGFDGTTGMGIGTKQTMLDLPIGPIIANAGFWVTNEANWNTIQGGNDGQLYKWDDGAGAWNLFYTPYTYPHPLRGGGGADVTPPVVVQATVATNGTSLTIDYNENVSQFGAYADSDLDLDGSIGGNNITLTYSSGNTTSAHVYTIGTTILQGEGVDLDYIGGTLQDDAGNALAAIVSRSVTNNSSQTTPDVTAPLVTDVYVETDGLSVQIGFDEPVTSGAGGTGGFTLTGSIRGAQSATWGDPVPGVIAGAKFMATTGNDGNDGSIGSPWLTLAYAVSQMSAGDALHIRGGTYVGAQTILLPSGTQGDPTIIAGYPGETAILSGTTVDGGRYKLIGKSWVDIRDLTITLLNHGLFFEGCDNINATRLTIHNIGQEGISPRYDSFNVLIDDCLIYDTGKRGVSYNGEGVYIGTGSGGPVDNSYNITVRNCVIHDTTDEGIEFKAGTYNCIAEGNELYNIATASWYGAIELSPTVLGVQSYGSNPNHIVRDNIIYDSDTAIVSDTGARIYNNTIYNLSFDAVGILLRDPVGTNYPMYIHHNTIDVPASRAYQKTSGTSFVTNNIGPSLASNTQFSSSFFLAEYGNYQLAPGAAVIDIGVVNPIVINRDGYGNARTIGTKSDHGAHEFGGIFPLTNVQNFNVPLTFGTNDTVTWAYVQPGNGWEDTSANDNDLASLSGQPVTNDSAQASQGGAPPGAPRAPGGASVSAGFIQ
jgi:hypothetical protein